MGDYAFLPSNDPTGYGWTLNLNTLEQGAKEVFIGKVSFDKGGFEVKSLGNVTNNPPLLDLTTLATKSAYRANT